MRTIEFNNEDIKECKLALLRQDLTSLQSAFLMQHITNLEQSLNEIKTIIEDCKKLMPHEFAWGEQTDNILEEIDKALGEGL